MTPTLIYTKKLSFHFTFIDERAGGLYDTEDEEEEEQEDVETETEEQTPKLRKKKKKSDDLVSSHTCTMLYNNFDFHYKI